MSMLWMSDSWSMPECLRHQTGVPFSARSGILLLQTNVGRKWGDDLQPPSAPKIAKEPKLWGKTLVLWVLGGSRHTQMCGLFNIEHDDKHPELGLVPSENFYDM